MNVKQAKGYIYAELEVRDAAYFYDEYMPRVRPVLETYGATFLIASNDVKVLEGGRQIKRVIMLEFESMAKAEAFYHSDIYQEVMAYRTRSADTHLFIVEGVTKT